MSTEHRWSKFWWQDWQNDIGLKTCSLAAQGLWMRMLCIAHNATPRGHLAIKGRALSVQELSQIVGVLTQKCQRLVDELERKDVFSRTDDGTIFCRRMVRDTEMSEEGRRNISKRWGGDGSPPPNRSPDREPDREPSRRPNGPALSPLIGTLLLEAEAEEESERKKEKGRSLRSLAHAHAIPPDWKPTDEDRRYATARGIDPDRAGEEFANHWLNANGRAAVKADWSRAFRNRVLVLEDQGRFRLNGHKPKLSVHEQIHRDLGTTSMLAQRWDDDPEPLPGNLPMLQ